MREEPQEAQFLAICVFDAVLTTATIFGITSPERSTLIREPLPSFSFLTLPALWAVTRRTVAPDNSIGTTSSTGVTLPDLFVCQEIDLTLA